MAKIDLKASVSGILFHNEINKKKRLPGRTLSFEKAKKIGILYDATSETDYELMKNYVRKLMSYSKDVVALGFYNENELPNTRFMKLGLDFFTKKSLN